MSWTEALKLTQPVLSTCLIASEYLPVLQQCFAYCPFACICVDDFTFEQWASVMLYYSLIAQMQFHIAALPIPPCTVGRETYTQQVHTCCCKIVAALDGSTCFTPHMADKLQL